MIKKANKKHCKSTRIFIEDVEMFSMYNWIGRTSLILWKLITQEAYVVINIKTLFKTEVDFDMQHIKVVQVAG